MIFWKPTKNSIRLFVWFKMFKTVGFWQQLYMYLYVPVYAVLLFHSLSMCAVYTSNVLYVKQCCFAAEQLVGCMYVCTFFINAVRRRTTLLLLLRTRLHPLHPLIMVSPLTLRGPMKGIPLPKLYVMHTQSCHGSIQSGEFASNFSMVLLSFLTNISRKKPSCCFVVWCACQVLRLIRHSTLCSLRY